MSFQDIIGQERALEIIASFLNAGRFKGGYFFSGPDGVGKKLTAKTLAKALNCPEKQFNSCDHCQSCKKIEANQHPDVHIIDPGNQEIKIEEIRSLQKHVSLRPYEARVKVFIIDNCHNLTAEASNALLKVLEEPPEDSIFILVSDKPALMFKTILSRCKVVKFSPFERSRLSDIFREKYSLDRALAHYLAYTCEGRFGRGLKLKETDSLSEKNRILDELMLNKKQAFGLIEAQNKDEVRKSLNIAATWFRDLYILKAGMPPSELIHADRASELAGVAQRYSFEELDQALRAITDALGYLDQNINLKLLLHNLGAQLWKG